MIEKITDAVCEKLRNEFPDIEMYTENVEQGLKLPCFFVTVINISHILKTGNRRFYECQISVQFIPESEDAKLECMLTEEKLYLLLEYISVDNALIAGTQPHSETTDEVLTFIINYGFFTDGRADPTAERILMNSIE